RTATPRAVSALSQKSRHSALPQFLQLRDERVRAAGEITVVLPQLLSGAVQHDDCRKPEDLVLHRQLPILLLHVETLLLASRKVELYEDQIVASIIFKLGLREDLFIEVDTPTAPVRTCKIEQNKFVIRLRLFLRFLVIVQPVRLGPGKLPTKENRSRDCEDNQTIRFHVSIFDVITPRRKSGTAHRHCGDHFLPSLAIARRNNAGLSTNNRNLTQMFRDELRHLEHAHLALAI